MNLMKREEDRLEIEEVGKGSDLTVKDTFGGFEGSGLIRVSVSRAM